MSIRPPGRLSRKKRRADLNFAVRRTPELGHCGLLQPPADRILDPMECHLAVDRARVLSGSLAARLPPARQ